MKGTFKYPYKINVWLPDSVKKRVQSSAALAADCGDQGEHRRQSFCVKDDDPHRQDCVRRPRNDPHDEKQAHHLG